MPSVFKLIFDDSAHPWVFLVNLERYLIIFIFIIALSYRRQFYNMELVFLFWGLGNSGTNKLSNLALLLMNSRKVFEL